MALTKTSVTNYHEKAQEALEKYYASGYRIKPAENDIAHVCGVAASIMMTRDNVLMGGGFATAVSNNDLEGAVERADSVCAQHLPFFVYCKKYIS
jgi:hypothetical protein